ncbi:hypothetical protein BDF19DRAFT_441878, partial [Syncephalis fuscata]
MNINTPKMTTENDNMISSATEFPLRSSSAISKREQRQDLYKSAEQQLTRRCTFGYNGIDNLNVLPEAAVCQTPRSRRTSSATFGEPASHILDDSNIVTEEEVKSEAIPVLRRYHSLEKQKRVPLISMAPRSLSSESVLTRCHLDDAAERKASRVLSTSCTYSSFRRKHPRVPSLCSPSEDQTHPFQVHSELEFYKAFESNDGDNDFIRESNLLIYIYTLLH